MWFCVRETFVEYLPDELGIGTLEILIGSIDLLQTMVGQLIL